LIDQESHTFRIKDLKLHTHIQGCTWITDEIKGVGGVLIL